MPSKLTAFVLIATVLTSIVGAAEPGERPLVVVLIGPPASGKSTQADYLNKKYRLPIIAVEDLIAGAKGGRPMDRSDPAVNALLRQKLQSLNVSRGFVLDGYPTTRAQADHLAALAKELRLPSPVVVQIQVPDEVVRERCSLRGGPEDKPEIVTRRLNEYHQEMDLVRDYYPDTDIWTIDGTREERGVSATLRLLIEDRR